ncbi:MAG: RNA polymerase sigma factor [Isosphaeraceae bacterium]
MAAGGPRGAIQALWDGGAQGDLDDSALLGRYLGRSREGAESAFRTLVERHGPMVVRVCKQRLGDPHAAQDAAQAVFLVLARKAGSVRTTASVAPWLYGVARRVASKAARRDLARRDAEAEAGAAMDQTDSSDSASSLDWEAVHQEVGRLPSKYRDPVVFCYLEGCTYEEAARRLGCPVGTVRVRLSRARDRLRDRLARRGFGPAAVAGFTGAGEHVPLTPEPLPAGWAEATVKASTAFASGSVSAGVVPAVVGALAREGIRSMLIDQWKIAAAICGLTACAFGSGAGLLAGQGPAQEKVEAPAKPATKVEITAYPAAPSDLERLLELARERFEAQKPLYERGRVTLDRFLDASRELMQAELNVARTPDAQQAALKAYRDRTAEVVERETAMFHAGRGTKADVAEARVALEQAEIGLRRTQSEVVAMKRAENGPRQGEKDSDLPDEVATLRARVDALEKQLDRVIKLLDRQGIDVPDARVPLNRRR